MGGILRKRWQYFLHFVSFPQLLNFSELCFCFTDAALHTGPLSSHYNLLSSEASRWRTVEVLSLQCDLGHPLQRHIPQMKPEPGTSKSAAMWRQAASKVVFVVGRGVPVEGVEGVRAVKVLLEEDFLMGTRSDGDLG